MEYGEAMRTFFKFSAPLTNYTGKTKRKSYKSAERKIDYSCSIALCFQNNAIEFSRFKKSSFRQLFVLLDHCDFDTEFRCTKKVFKRNWNKCYKRILLE